MTSRQKTRRMEKNVEIFCKINHVNFFSSINILNEHHQHNIIR